MFYSAEELSGMLRDVGYGNVAAKTVFAGMIGFHRATKP
jgi:demethylmenaquinone methyltransferase/2-methoxy-6-polyprenyl-1,4-benzoquinol methylase